MRRKVKIILDGENAWKEWVQEDADVSQVIHTMSNLSEDILALCFGTGDKEGWSTDKDTQSQLEVDRTPTGKSDDNDDSVDERNKEQKSLEQSRWAEDNQLGPRKVCTRANRMMLSRQDRRALYPVTGICRTRPWRTSATTKEYQ